MSAEQVTKMTPRLGTDAAVGGTPEGGGEKQMQTFRLPRELVTFLRREAERAGRDLTAQVVRSLDGIRTNFGLPAAASALLEADRKALGMDRLEYLLHALYTRSLTLREKGAGFDGPGVAERRVR